MRMSYVIIKNNKKRHMKRFILFILLTSSSLSYSQINRYGSPFITNYTIKDYNAYSQNWVVVQNAEGIMYFGNNNGLLEYDGVNWNLIPINKGAIIKSLAIDSSGIIYIGADNEFGFVTYNTEGKLFYTSLSDSLTKEQQNFSAVYRIYNTDNGTLFCANKKIFKYKNNKIEIIKLPKGGYFTLQVSDDYYMGDYYKGLMILKNDSYINCKGGDFYKAKDIVAAFQFSKNKILFATSLNGLFIYNIETGQSKEPEFNNYKNLHSFLTENYLYNGIKQNNKYTFITLYGGVVITDNEFNIIEKYNKESGIQDEITLACYKNTPTLYSSTLWLSLNNGISKIETSSPFRVFNEKNGLQNEVIAITEFEGNIYIATSNGIWLINNNEELSIPKFEKLKNTSGQCWNFTEHKNSLFVSSLYIYKITDKKISETLPINEAYKVLSSEVKENILYAGREKGLSIYSIENDNLKLQNNVQKLNEKIDHIVEESTGDLWLTTDSYELIKLSVNDSDTTITRFSNKDIFSDTEYLYCFKYNNQVFFSTDNHLYIYDNKTSEFISEKFFSSEIHNELVHISNLKTDNKGNIWAVSFHNNTHKLKYLKKEGTNFKIKNTETNRLNGTIILDIYPDKNGILWIGTPEGLYTYNTNTDVSYDKTFYTLIRKIIINNDSTILNGGKQLNSKFEINKTSKLTEFDIKNNSLTFHYAAPFFIQENQTDYYTLLEGYDKNWSKPTKITFKEYTNLREGKYTFKVKAKNIYGIESEIAEYSFKIFPPWYRTAWAYIAYLILFISFVWLTVKLNTRRLQKDKERLEGIVKERTAEITQQKEEIETIADNLQVANEEISSKNVLLKQKNESITSSIEYASRIQHALLPPEEIIKKHLPENFILFKPRDIVSGDFYWFKQIDNYTVYAAADCTGHGVPGAFMSMLGISFLNEIVTKEKFYNPANILNKLRDKVKLSLRQTGKDHESKDGMDIAVCVIDNENFTVEYAGAYNPLYILRKEELIEIKATRNPIGIYLKEKPFENHKFQLEKGDVLYTFSDGYVDQFGGEDDSKFKTKNFKKLLLKIYDKPMDKQKEILDGMLLQWQGKTEQTDDIIVFGVRI